MSFRVNLVSCAGLPIALVACSDSSLVGSGGGGTAAGGGGWSGSQADSSTAGSAGSSTACTSSGKPSPAGGCCSDVVPCESGLTCSLGSPVHPGSSGICEHVACPAYDCEDRCAGKPEPDVSGCSYPNGCSCTDKPTDSGAGGMAGTGGEGGAGGIVPCSASEPCAKTQDCDPRAGVCRPALSCFSDRMCGAGQACLPNVERGVFECVTLGNTGLGLYCKYSSECRTGACVGSFCAQKCGSNSDCPTGLFCQKKYVQHEGQDSESFSLLDKLVCEPKEFECPDPDKVMITMGPGCVKVCTNDADCPNQDCYSNQLVESDQAYCYGQASLCGPNEIQRAEDKYPCVIFQACFTNADCPPPYECALFEHPEGYYMDFALGYSGVCSRDPAK